MIRVLFKKASGQEVVAEGEADMSLLTLAQANGIDLEGTCESCMACSTCHVVVAPAWYDRLPEPTEEEEDLLDLAFGLEATSRLSCQILLTDDLDGLEVKVPAESRNMM